ncbi:MAG: hypothetical protein J7J14_00165 [Thermotogaceae bacterium]|nr:hypothetical protein [Thermotogaceae bacterium]
MDLLSFVVFMSTILTLAFSWGTFIVELRKREEEPSPYDELESRILELMGRFKHLSAVRLELLDRKIKEVKDAVREANEVLAKLMVKISDIEKLKEEIEKSVKEGRVVEESPAVSNTELKEEPKEEGEEAVEDDMEVERKILKLHEKGLSDVEIARRLNMGIGEVRLILNLFGKKAAG